ncbi:hypothetical protein Pcinc_019834 [Petrolisthes cinctipes]|uniref:Uncharacterized protein n=1 Tax=Petrolisthes cinctipes TaxID=88211 RepID=A0AAE1FKR9_PETCI|nr:hypothetical protein Pcinc_019834 [Petrolisthes cinctipes]
MTIREAARKHEPEAKTGSPHAIPVITPVYPRDPAAVSPPVQATPIYLGPVLRQSNSPFSELQYMHIFGHVEQTTEVGPTLSP